MKNKKGSVKMHIALGMTLVVVGIIAIVYLEVSTIGDVIAQEPGKMSNNLMGWTIVIGGVFFFVFSVMGKKLKNIRESKHDRNQT